VVVTRSVLAEFVPFDRDQGNISELENADFLMRLVLLKDENGPSGETSLEDVHKLSMCRKQWKESVSPDILYASHVREWVSVTNFN